jgi:hypothetical protein
MPCQHGYGPRKHIKPTGAAAENIASSSSHGGCVAADGDNAVGSCGFVKALYIYTRRGGYDVYRLEIGICRDKAFNVFCVVVKICPDRDGSLARGSTGIVVPALI